MEPFCFPNNKGASNETPSRSPLRAIHLRLADCLRYGRAGLGTQSGFSPADRFARTAAPGIRYCFYEETLDSRLLGFNPASCSSGYDNSQIQRLDSVSHLHWTNNGFECFRSNSNGSTFGVCRRRGF